MKPPNTIKSKVVLNNKLEMKSPPDPCCYALLEKYSTTKKLNCNLKAVSSKSLLQPDKTAPK